MMLELSVIGISFLDNTWVEKFEFRIERNSKFSSNKTHLKSWLNNKVNTGIARVTDDVTLIVVKNLNCGFALDATKYHSARRPRRETQKHAEI